MLSSFAAYIFCLMVGVHFQEKQQIARAFFFRLRKFEPMSVTVVVAAREAVGFIQSLGHAPTCGHFCGTKDHQQEQANKERTKH